VFAVVMSVRALLTSGRNRNTDYNPIRFGIGGGNYDNEKMYPMGFQPGAMKGGLSFEYWSKKDQEAYNKKQIQP